MTRFTLVVRARVFTRYKSLVGLRELPAANGDNCVLMLRKLCPLRPGAYHVGVTKVPLCWSAAVFFSFFCPWLFIRSLSTNFFSVVYSKYLPLVSSTDSCFWRRTSTSCWSVNGSAPVSWPRSPCNATHACSSSGNAFWPSARRSWRCRLGAEASSQGQPGRLLRSVWGSKPPSH